MIVSNFIDRLAAETGYAPREVELYARRLREADLFPERSSARKIPITPAHAANLLLALMSADNARQAADAVKSYGALPGRPATPAKTLIEFLTMALERGHSNASLRRLLVSGTISVMRRDPAAVFQWRSGQDEKAVRFQPERGPERRPPRMSAETHFPGDALIGLSAAIADVAAPFPTID